MKSPVQFSALFLATCFFISFPSTSHPFRTEKMMTISGKVVDEESKRPVSTTLTIQSEGFNPIKTSSDANGNFVVAIPAASAYKVSVRAPGFETQEDIIEILPDEEGVTNHVEIKLTPYVKLTLGGQVLSEKDKKPVNAECRV